MNRKQMYNLKLIDGRFTPLEARRLISELFNYKINYHQMEKFSHEERFGNDLTNSKSRIEDLKDQIKNFEKIIEYTAEKKLELKIESFIKITF